MPESPQEELEELLAGRLIKQAEAEDFGVEKTTASDTDPNRGGEQTDPDSNKVSGTGSTEHDDAAVTAITTVAANTDVEAGAIPTVVTTSPSFAKVEKSLISLGFFTPSSRRIKDQKVKRISFTRSIDGKKVEATAEFHPSAMLGLPITADQDKFLALHDIITNLLQTQGKISNPIRFTSADLLRLLNKRVRTGKNYKDIIEWLDVMTATTIMSNGVVYEAGKQRFARDRFHVFERAVSVGKELPDGTIADANYVWLSDWQLDNINQNFLLPIDLLTYRQLKNHIAKALVPLLQVWLFASQKAGSFEKRYDELCEMLSLQIYKAPSLITRQLQPSLDELIHYEYLEKWRIEKTSDRKAYKIIFFHGPKFHRDRRRRLEQKSQAESTVVIAQSGSIEPELPEPGKLQHDSAPETVAGATKKTATTVPQKKVGKTTSGMSDWSPAPTPAEQKPIEQVKEESNLIDELAVRGMMPSVALKLLNSIPAERQEQIRDYIDYWDSVKQSGGNVGVGLLYDLIKTPQQLPPTFVTRRQREARQRQVKRDADWRMVKDVLEQRYEAHRERHVDRFIAETVTPPEFERRVTTCKEKLSAQTNLDFPSVWNRPETIERQAHAMARAEIAQQVSIITFEDFRKAELPHLLAELQLDPADLGINIPGQTAGQEPTQPQQN